MSRYSKRISPSLSLMLAVCLLLSLAMVFTPVTARAAVNYEFKPGETWRLIWRDEFDGNDPDGTPSDNLNKWGVNCNNWGFQTGDGSVYNIPGWGNNEMESYHPDFARVVDGQLVMMARKMGSFPGEPASKPNPAPTDKSTWWSAKLTSSPNYYEGEDTQYKPAVGFAHTYGRYEARIKLPDNCTGWWPAFWMLPEDNVYGTWAASGEIDIMEAHGNQFHLFGGTIHFGGMWPSNTYSNMMHGITPDTIGDFHVYAVEWEDNEAGDAVTMKFFYDDVNYFTLNNSQWYTTSSNPLAPFDQDFHMILNLAVGGTLGNGEPTAPGDMIVDYVRVYERVREPKITGVTVSPAEIFDEDDRTLSVAIQGRGLDQLQLEVGIEGYPNSFAKTNANGRASINIGAGELPIGDYNIIVRNDGVLTSLKAPFKVVPTPPIKNGDVVYLVSKLTEKVVGHDGVSWNVGGQYSGMTTLTATYEAKTAPDPYTDYTVVEDGDRWYLKAGNGLYFTIEGDAQTQVRPRSDGGPNAYPPKHERWESLIFDWQSDGTFNIRRTGTDGGRWVNVGPDGSLKSVVSDPGESGKFNVYKAGNFPGVLQVSPNQITFTNLNPRTVTVRNTGTTQATGPLAVALSGANADAFTLSATSLNSIGGGGTDTFTVTPVATAYGTYTASVMVGNTDIGYQTVSLSYTITPPDRPVITTAALPGVTEGVPYSAALEAMSSVPVTWSLASGSLPEGLTFSPDGVISGIPSAEGTYNFTVRAGNDGGYDTKALSIVIKPIVFYAVELDPGGSYAFPAVKVGYGAQAARSILVKNAGVNATGGLNVTITGDAAGAFALSAASIPSIGFGSSAGFTVAPVTGLVVGTYHATVTVAGGSVPAVSLDVSFTVEPTVIPPAIVTGSLPDGAANTGYSAALQATGDAPITWTIVSGALPGGLSLNASTGVISGTPSAAGTFSFTVKAANAGGYMTRELLIVIGQGGGGNLALKFERAEITWNVSAGYNMYDVWPLDNWVQNNNPTVTGPLTLTVTGGGKDAFVISTTSYSADPYMGFGVRVEPKVGLSAGVYEATYTLSGPNIQNASFTARVTVTGGVQAPPLILTMSLPNGTVGTPYSANLYCTGIPPFTWRLGSGAMPDGLTLSSDGVISGMPTATGTFNFAVCSDSAAGSDFKGFTIVIAPAPVPPFVATGSLPKGEADTAYHATLTATGDAPITWNLDSGALPDGLTLSPDGVISGTPIASGTFAFTVTAVNGAGSSGRALFIVIEDGEPPVTGRFTVTGDVRSYNPNRPTTIKLMQGDEEKYSTTIEKTSGSGQATQTFTFTGVLPGDYTLVISKDAHTTFTVQKITVETDLDLTKDMRPAVQLMTLLCGDINGDGMINDGDLAVLWLAANYNKSVEQANALCDLNGDGMINDGDLAILWLAVNYNKGAVLIP